MTWPFNRTVTALVIVALAHSIVLGWMVFDRVRLLTSGHEVVLPVIPVDPRSLFRGDYVRLSYAVSQVPPPPDAPDTLRRGTILYVTIVKDEKADWIASASATAAPRTLKPAQMVLRGRTSHNWRRNRGGTLRMRYGIESYFVQEGHGRALEKQAREGKVAAVISVGHDGQAAIKGLMINGKRAYTEPLF
jgi:uncharacterized membrane-anchored protein